MASLFNLITSTLLFLLPLILLTSAKKLGVPKTNYNIFIKTGDVDYAGTESKISLRLYNRIGHFVEIDDLKSWGAMAEGHDYYEKGTVDFFKGTTPLRLLEVCKIQLNSDGKGDAPGWYVDFVAVATGSRYKRFDVNQWLSVNDAPNQLYAVVDKCLFA